jgi:hypothetical protein
MGPKASAVFEYRFNDIYYKKQGLLSDVKFVRERRAYKHAPPEISIHSLQPVRANTLE